jgi:SAM-dependent methyltransferase
VLAELADFLRQRKGNPSWGWPNYDHLTDERSFPSRILTEASLARSLDPARLERIRRALRGDDGEPIRIEYRCPWTSSSAIEPASLDWIYSHSVMEHVDDVEQAYECMHRWLKPGGFLSHQIDLRSHGLFPEWDGHWAVARWQWQVIRGRRIYLINRLPYTAHARLLHRLFDVRTELRMEEEGLPRERLQPPFDVLEPGERRTSGYFVVAVKR